MRRLDYVKLPKDLLASQNEVDAAQLQHHSLSLGAQSSCNCVVGDLVTLHGTIRALRIRPHISIPMVEAELWDGTGSITLLWMGRRNIAGITPGRSLLVSGRIAPGDAPDMRIIFNPRYELLESRH